MTINRSDVRWRAAGSYLPTSVLKQALLAETRQFLRTYASTGDIAGTRRALVDDALPQRSVYSRKTIAKTIRMRLMSWQPPSWVLDDLVSFAADDLQPSLQAALLLHVVRQDTLLYDLVHQVIVPRWERGERVVVRGDVQRFLDAAEVDHTEIAGWSYATRQKLAGNALTILRDYGLLRGSPHGSPQKQIVEPVVPGAVAHHLVSVLCAEGISAAEIADHPDWRIWLWDRRRAAAFIAASAAATKEQPA